MAVITTINASDLITDSRAVINTNFANLNSDKIETSYLDTDTTLAANSDTKIPTQKAVKAYVDAGGNVNASETTKGIVEEATQAETDAGTATGATGAKLLVTPAKLAASRYSPIRSVTAGATINGATLPVPVYQNKTDNEFYACDGNDTAALKFLGFAISNGVDGGAFNVQFSGIVSGFTGLDEGQKYYVQDAVGTIGTSPGTAEILVGVAISQTELVIQKGKRYASGTASFTATATTTVTTGFRPSRVRIHAIIDAGTALFTDWAQSQGGWTVAGGNDCVYMGGIEGGGAPDTRSGVSTDGWKLPGAGGGDWHSGSVQNITDTGFELANTEGTNGQTALIFWEAEGEL